MQQLASISWCLLNYLHEYIVILTHTHTIYVCYVFCSLKLFEEMPKQNFPSPKLIKKGLGCLQCLPIFFTTPFSFSYLFIFSIVIKNNGRQMDKLLLLYYNITSFFGSRLLICDFFFWFRKINVYGGPSRLADSLLVTFLEVFFFFFFFLV